MIARSILSYASHYGAEEKAAAEAAADPQEWMDFGASRATSIVACVPAFMDASGKSAGLIAVLGQLTPLRTRRKMWRHISQWLGHASLGSPGQQRQHYARMGI